MTAPNHVCTCKSVLVDHRNQTVTHPYRSCPNHGKTTKANDQ